MKNKLFILLSFPTIALLIFIIMKLKSSNPELRVINEMYRQYFKTTNALEFKIPYSTSLTNLIKENEVICSQIKTQDICGWGANNDVLYNDQEYAADLNFENSKFRISMHEGQVEVNFHVYPTMPAESRYQKRILFKMVAEDGTYLIDDITYYAGKGGVYSAREMIKAENDYYQIEASK